MDLTEYNVKCENITQNTVFALVSDLHGNDPAEAIRILKYISPNYILAAGDIFEVMDGSEKIKNESGFALLAACASIAPTFFALGNHEVGATHSWSLKWKLSKQKGKDISEENMKRLVGTGVHFLDGSFEIYDGIAFCGIGTGLVNKGGIPKLEVLDSFCGIDAPKILICHHPEYYKKYLKDKNIDLIVSGHAHGGQWRIFGRGVYAPGQGLFPKYTSGVYDNKLVVSRGLKKGRVVPRIFNPPEIVKITIVNE